MVMVADFEVANPFIKPLYLILSNCVTGGNRTRATTQYVSKLQKPVSITTRKKNFMKLKN